MLGVQVATATMTPRIDIKLAENRTISVGGPNKNPYTKHKV
jgi:hypothetical protein